MPQRRLSITNLSFSEVWMAPNLALRFEFCAVHFQRRWTLVLMKLEQRIIINCSSSMDWTLIKFRQNCISILERMSMFCKLSDSGLLRYAEDRKISTTNIASKGHHLMTLIPSFCVLLGNPHLSWRDPLLRCSKYHTMQYCVIYTKYLGSNLFICDDFHISWPTISGKNRRMLLSKWFSILK
jgi:hypothetical protein